MSRQKAVSFTIKGFATYNGKTLGSSSEAEKKILAAKEAAEKAGVTIIDFSAHHTSVEVDPDPAPARRQA
jgi:hypothetical protein